MSKLIEFLERMGREGDLRYATRTDVESALMAAGVEPAAHRAVLSGDPAELAAVLQAKPNVCCAIFPVDEDPPPISFVDKTAA